MKKWYKSKTVGIAIVQVLTSLAGLVNNSINFEAFIVSLIMAVVLVINRIYGTDTEIQK